MSSYTELWEIVGLIMSDLVTSLLYYGLGDGLVTTIRLCIGESIGSMRSAGFQVLSFMAASSFGLPSLAYVRFHCDVEADAQSAEGSLGEHC
jgi:hypothetical protein